MRSVSLNQSRADQLVVEIGRAWGRALLGGAGAGAWTTAFFLAGDSALAWALWLAGLPLVPILAVAVARALRARRRVLSRSVNRLLLDGEPLELARVELRMTHMPVTKVPNGYALSLWVMTANGPEDIPLGRYRTLLDASKLSGALEEFVQRANTRQPGKTGV